jgi:hypothetical protein
MHAAPSALAAVALTVILGGAAAAIAYLLALTLAAAVFDLHAHVRLFFRLTDLAPARDDECPICLDGLRNGGLAVGGLRGLAVGACRHAFHAACLAPWLARAPTCPVCRADLLSPDRRARAAYGWCVDASAHVDALTAALLGS